MMRSLALITLVFIFACMPAMATEPEYIDADMLEMETEPSDMILLRKHAMPMSADYRVAVFDRYDIVDSLKIDTPLPSDSLFRSDAFNWLDDATFNLQLIRQTRQRYMIANAQYVRYNESLLPEPPRKFHAVVDPTTAMISIVEDNGLTLSPQLPDSLPSEELKKRHWIHNFDSKLQFAQAYVSPNWYQGGSNNLTMLFGALYNVKLNQTFHPNLLCEATVSYKLNIHGTPEDSLRNYNISEDLFQFNGKVGFRAARKWFYSMSASFKTQFFHSYEINKPQLKAGFLSPSELNLGVGMTYNHTNTRKTFILDISISPLSWNMKTCIERDMNVTDFGIRPGHKVVHEYGSNAEMKIQWNIAYNIHYTSRMFIFTDYTYLQGDWENTFSFDINRFLSTQLQVHLRYDSSTPRLEDSRWHVWQLNEVLSFGFSYKFATI